MSQTPLKPWVAIRKNGTVECGHCICMAGLAETCSHVAAILHWLETAVRIRDNTSCTSKPNSWLPPSIPTPCQQVPNVTMEELEQIASKRKQNTGNIPTSGLSWTEVARHTPTQQELDDFYMDLSKNTGRKPAILSLIPQHSDSFIQSSEHLPHILQSLYEPDYLHLDYLQLLAKVKDVCRQPVTEAQVSHLEQLTRGQAKNRQWFRYRAGRITASQLYQVCLYKK